MLAPLPLFARPADPAVLLVLLPAASSGAAQALTLAALDELQGQLGAAIQVLPVDEGTHPAVVRSFDGRGVPAWVLTRHGRELWHEQGLPNGEGIVALLLSKLTAPPTQPSILLA